MSVLGKITRMSDAEADNMYPKRYMVELPAGRTDPHGATVVYTITKRAALKVLREARK